MMKTQRDTTRVKRPRVRLAMIALAMACGRGDAPAAAGPATVTPPPRAQAARDTTVPAGAMGDAVRRGRALLAATHDSLPSHVGSSLRCFSCHLDEGRRSGGLSLIGAYTRYPQFRARRARVDLIEDRVNDCFLRSMNGHAIAADGDDMRDIVAYLAWLSRGVAVGDTVKSQGAAQVATLDADTTRGAQIFSENCVRCHGAAGQGSAVATPLWGPKSYNVGAGMARFRTAALFVLHNMPFDKPNSLTSQQALDVARYVDTRPRPDFAGKEHDWPRGSRPNDVPYSTRVDSISDANTARIRADNAARTRVRDTARPRAHNGAH